MKGHNTRILPKAGPNVFKLSFFSPARLLAVLSPVCLLAAPALAQNPPAAPAAAPAQSALPAHPATKANDELLAKAARLYYYPGKAGLNGFDCAVHPDWREVFLSANKGSAVAADDPHFVLLNSVTIILHARLKGGSTLDWNQPAHPDQPLDKDSSDAIDRIHGGIEQTLLGFMQSWTPFVNGSILPASSEGLTIVQTANWTTIHAEQGDTKMTESLDSGLVLRHIDVVMSGASIQFAPSFKPTDKGLLVNAFLAKIQPPGASPEQAQEMRAEVEYQTFGGYPIPAKLNIDVSNTATLNFVLDGCTVNPPSK